MEIKIEDLLGLISKYYPLGLHKWNKKDYPGYRKWLAIINEMVAALDAGHLPASMGLMDDLKGQFPSFVVQDLSNYQSPSLSICGVIEESDTKEMSRKRSLWIDISMLGGYYTFFIEDEHRIKEEGINPDLGSLHPYYALYNQAVADNSLVTLLKQVPVIMQRHFPDYKPLNHGMLFTTEFKMAPYGEDTDVISCNAYDLLFSKRYIGRKFVYIGS